MTDAITNLKALTDSRDHWVRMRNNKDCKEKPIQDYCTLCDIYYGCKNTDEPCDGCPIKIKTGHKFCINSPYTAAWMAWSTSFHQHKHKNESWWNIWQAKADKMIEFLNQLIAEHTPKNDPVPKAT